MQKRIQIKVTKDYLENLKKVYEAQAQVAEEELVSDDPPLAKENYTCYICKDNKVCKYAWDVYCTNGDCLAEK